MRLQFYLNGMEQNKFFPLSVVDESKGQAEVTVDYNLNVVYGDVIEVKVDGDEIFEGSVFQINAERSVGIQVLICRGKTNILYQKYVLDTNHDDYTLQDAGVIVKDLIDYYFSGILTSSNVNSSTGTTITNIDGFGKTVGDVIEELADRSGCVFYVDSVNDMHFFVSGAEDSGLSITTDKVFNVKKFTKGEEINKVIIHGRDDVSGTAGSGYPEKYVYDRRISSNTEATELAEALLNKFQNARVSADIYTYGFYRLHTEQAITVNLPADGYNDSLETVKRIQYSFRKGVVETIISVGDENPTLTEALTKIIRDLAAKRDDFSVMRDAYFDKMHHHFTGESKDGFLISEIGGAVTMRIGYWKVESGAVLGGVATIYEDDYLIDLSKNPMFKTKIKVLSNTKQDLYATILNEVTGEQFGFYVNDGDLKAVWDSGGGGPWTRNIQSVNADDVLTLEGRYISGERIEFWVNGVLKETVTTDLPDTTKTARAVFVRARTDENVNKILEVYFWATIQDW